MRTSIIIAQSHGSEEWELVSGPNVPIGEQIEAMREAKTWNGVHEHFALIQRWENGFGVYDSLRFEKPDDRKNRLEKIRRDHEAHIEREKADAQKPDEKPNPKNKTVNTATLPPATPPSSNVDEGKGDAEIVDL